MTRATRRPATPSDGPPEAGVGTRAGQGSDQGAGGRPGGVPGAGVARRRPVALVAVCALVVLQAGLLVGLAGVWLVDLVRGAVQLPAATVFLVLFALGVAAVLVLAVRGLWAGRRWARSPVMTWQVLLVVLAFGWWGSDPAPWVVAVLAGAVAVAVGLLLPSVVAATVDRPES